MSKYLLFFLTLTLLSCGPNGDKKTTTSEEDSMAELTEANPPSDGFDIENSDPKAIDIADQVMLAMGGRKAWDETAILKWTFFGRRTLIWNKNTGDVFIDFPSDTLQIALNIHNKNGRAKKNNQFVEDEVQLSELLEKGYKVWVNDSYWLVMPFKLKDSGVTLKYERSDSTQAGAPAEVLCMTFHQVGVTPENKYEVYVTQDNLIKQWAFFAQFEQDSASYTWPFDNYKEYGGLLLSGERSDGKGPSNLSVYDVLDSAQHPNIF